MRRFILMSLLVLSMAMAVGQTINRIEYFFDNDPGYGSATPVTYSPGSSVTVTFNINTSGLSKGVHYLQIRAGNVSGRWSTVSVMPVCVPDNGPGIPVMQLEYFIDNDPGIGNATQVAITPGTQVPAFFQVNTTGTGSGMHYLCVRAKDSDSRWSILSYYPFVDLSHAVSPDITDLEYFIDTDPGFGLGISIPVTTGPKVSAFFTPSVPTLSEGVHFLCVRAKNQAGAWSTLQHYVFNKSLLIKQPITGIEYFIDEDPGFGSGHPVAIVPSNSVVSQFSPDTTGMTEGNRLLVVRARDAAGNWSIVHDAAFTYNSTYRIWTGVVSDDWNVPGNWSPEGVPGWNDDVFIQSAVPFMPVVRHQGLSCRKVVVSPGAQLHLEPGIILTVNGDLKLE